MQGRALALSPRRLIDRLWLPQGNGRRSNSFTTWQSAGDWSARRLGRLGSLEVHLAGTADEVREAQRLRYAVFYKQGTAVASAFKLLARRDVDGFDGICDHLLVVDRAANGQKPAVVGTYRLLRQDVAERNGGFYSAGEFDIGGLLARHRGLQFLELGRSCVLPSYRNKRTLELLWHAIWVYVLRHRLDVMIGCASLEGTAPERHELPLSYLHHFARASEPWRARARAERYIEMNRLPKEAIDPRAALRELPPLLKGYLRLGCSVGEGAVIDRQFGTTDVLIVLPVAAIAARYLAHFGQAASRRAA
jgi:L-ornithine Nalpha-acyltransferase